MRTSLCEGAEGSSACPDKVSTKNRGACLQQQQYHMRFAFPYRSFAFGFILAAVTAATEVASFALGGKATNKPEVPAPQAPNKKDAMDLSSVDHYRGSKKWAGLLPQVTDNEKSPRKWDEGFRQFLLKYGMFNHVVYDVFIKGDNDFKNAQGLRGTSRFKNDMDTFTQKGLKFRYKNKLGETKMEYDFSEDYHIIGNMVCSPRSFFTAEDNWFGFVALSNDEKEMIIVFRGTETTKEWVENATLFTEKLDGEEPETGFALFWNSKQLRVHCGFQQLYRQKTVQQDESPKDTVHRLVKQHKDKLEGITVLGHSLGGAMCQLAGVDLVQRGVSGDVPVTVIGWAAPKIGNAALAQRVKELHPKLRVLRITNPIDSVAHLPPDWLWSITAGGYKAIGTELTISNANLCSKGVVKDDEGNSPNHNLQMYLHCIDPSRDVALMNKVGNVIPELYCIKHNISPVWHSQTWPRTIYE